LCAENPPKKYGWSNPPILSAENQQKKIRIFDFLLRENYINDNLKLIL